ncbi:unnamed protein product, partial [Prunus brigantina]
PPLWRYSSRRASAPNFSSFNPPIEVGVWFDSYKSTIQSRITKETVNDFPFALQHHELVIYINHLDSCPISVSIIYKYFSFMFFMYE